MAKYVSPEAREKRKKQRRIRLIAMYTCMAAFVLVLTFGIVKVVEFFSRDDEKPPLLANSGIQQPNTDVDKQQEEWEGYTGPVEQTINLGIVEPDMTMIQVPENGRVDTSYFSDAMFIGDSLADGFNVYSSSLPMGSSGATYITARSIGPRTFLQPNVTINVSNQGAIDPWAKIDEVKPGKIYVTLGTNALVVADSTPESIIADYRQFVDKLREHAPDAIIYITTVTPVAAFTSEERPLLSFDRILTLNKLIAQMCNEKGLALLNLYDVLRSDAGYLREDIAQPDGIHLTPTGYGMWADYLITHTVYSPTSPYVPGSPYYYTT